MYLIRGVSAFILSAFAWAFSSWRQNSLIHLNHTCDVLDFLDFQAVCLDLKRWLIEDAAPVWAAKAFDDNGGFAEFLMPNGQPSDPQRRARVPPRQLYSFAAAADMGWLGPSQTLLERGFERFIDVYRRPDGLYRTLADAAGQPLDDCAHLYDQAFALLGFAAVFPRLGEPASNAAHSLLANCCTQLRNPYGGFVTSSSSPTLGLSNPHMHLLEACLAWTRQSETALWHVIADEIVDLALRRFIDSGSGGVREVFGADWASLDCDAGTILEPGHQFEWAWLLLAWVEARGSSVGSNAEAAQAAAYRMIELGLAHGVDRTRGVAVDALQGNLQVKTATARAWPQTEWLKAMSVAAAQTRDQRFVDEAVSAANAIQIYLKADNSGLWFDTMMPSGEMSPGPSPASSFYHLACAIGEANKQMLRLCSKI